MTGAIVRSAGAIGGGAIAAVCAALLLSACGAGYEEVPAEVIQAPAAAVDEFAAGPDVPSAAADPPLAMEENGIVIADPGGGPARSLAFGMAEDEVLAAVAFRGEAERGTSPECGPGPLQYASWPDGVGLFFMDGEFGGWWLDGRDGSAVTTRAGIGPGSTRDALQAAYDVEIGESTLGMEFFTTGGISGLLDGEGADARVTHMWAGLNCVFR
jgi:hypothetical protein